MFFSFKPNAMLILLPNVGLNAHKASNNNQNLSLNDDLESMRNGKESNYFQPLDKKAKKSYEKSHVFQHMWVC